MRPSLLPILIALISPITPPTQAQAQEEIQFCFLEVVNATGLPGDLQVAIDDKPVQGGRGYSSGGSTGALGFVPDTLEIKFRHPACPEITSVSLTLDHQDNALVAVYYINKTDPETGELIKELKVETIKPEPTPEEMHLSLVTIDPRNAIGALSINGTEIPLEPFKPRRVSLPKEGNFRITHAGKDITPPLLIENKEHHLVFAFVDEASRSIVGNLFIARIIRPAN
jgi:hypothetical protein